MRKSILSTKAGGYAFLALLALPFILFSPIVTYMNHHYAKPNECTIKSAEFSKGGTGSKVGSSKNSIAIETAECGLLVTHKVEGSQKSITENVDLINSYKGQKLTFMIGPAAWNPGHTAAESVILPK